MVIFPKESFHPIIVYLSIVILYILDSITGILWTLINEESGHGSDITQGVSWFLTNFPIFYILHDIPQIVWIFREHIIGWRIYHMGKFSSSIGPFLLYHEYSELTWILNNGQAVTQKTNFFSVRIFLCLMFDIFS